jgi:RimJ/RimL family protein N-acetyltransferase
MWVLSDGDNNAALATYQLAGGLAETDQVVIGWTFWDPSVKMPDWSEKPILKGSRVLLRPFAEHDIAAMAEILADPEVLRLTGSVHTTEEANSRGRIPDAMQLEWYRTRASAPGRLDLAVVERATDALVGEVVLNEYDAANASCNFRILIGPLGRDRGLGSEATKLVVEYGLASLGLHRIELSVYAFNPRALHVYEKAGFVTEGIARDAFCFDGAWIDAISMSILSTD